ncbi:MAG: long-chain fatty acid--CoA ligase [Gammaproteobacteria bacterium]|nr:long-chain fatty acid--CoA ligase [Gammaproteobacteria bacterium]
MSNSLIANDISMTLPGLFRERVKRTPNAVAYRQYEPAGRLWRDFTWRQTADEVARWQAALEKHHLKSGDRVGIMLNNCREWMMFEQAALGLGLVVVPIYTLDSADNAVYILNHANVRVLLIKGYQQWNELVSESDQMRNIVAIISIDPIQSMADSRLICLAQWLQKGRFELQCSDGHPDQLATIVYTSGTTGRPKGVMLSHQNILSNVESGLNAVPVYADDMLLSFLPLSHMFERTVGYYLPMMCGACVTYSRGIKYLSEDLKETQPTMLASVPRVYERVYQKVFEQLKEKPFFLKWLFDQSVRVGWYRFQYRQHSVGWHARLLLWPVLEKRVAKKFQRQLGGKIRISVSGGAALSSTISELFLSLGIQVLQGYGLTEASPLVSINREHKNDPASVGHALPGIDVKLGNQNELLVRGPNVMLGYWHDPQATRHMIDADGWLHTGDIAEFRDQRIYITGRIKEIIVLSSGEKLAPADMEAAAKTHACFDEVMIYGEGKPYPVAIIALNPEHWQSQAQKHNLPDSAWTQRIIRDRTCEEVLLKLAGTVLQQFPGYARIRRVVATLEPWTVDNMMLTPTLKIKRAVIAEVFKDEINRVYQSD